VQGSLPVTYKSLQTGQHSYLRSLLSFPSHRSSLTARLKIKNSSLYHSAPVLWNSHLLSDLRHVALRVTPTPILNSQVVEYLIAFQSVYIVFSLTKYINDKILSIDSFCKQHLKQPRTAFARPAST